MNSEEFVSRIQEVVYRSVVQGTVLLLQKPPGRRPSAALVELSRWFNELSAYDRKCIQATIRLSVRDAVFEMLTVLDGVKTIREAEEEMGTLELRYNTKEESILLNGPTGKFLHDIFAAQVPPE